MMRPVFGSRTDSGDFRSAKREVTSAWMAAGLRKTVISQSAKRAASCDLIFSTITSVIAPDQ
jgi:nicotinic acid phosphoribosyltransferase